MNVLQALAQYLGSIVNYLNGFASQLTSTLGDLFCILFRESLNLSWSVMGSLPVPDSLLHFTWPGYSTVTGQVLYALGVPEAMAILSAAFMIKISMKLVPLVMAA